MPRIQKTPRKPSFVIRTHSLTREHNDFLKELSQDASDRLGWTVSHSAVIRAMVQYAKDRTDVFPEALFPLIEQELTSGVVWGHRRK